MPPTSRRALLQSAACGFGYLAFAGMSASLARGAETPLNSSVPHLLPRAKRVIFLFMHGGPSHVDTFNYKPRLQVEDVQELPFERAANIDAVPKLMGSPWKFARRGESGLWVSELFPHVARRIDDFCVVR